MKKKKGKTWGKRTAKIYWVAAPSTRTTYQGRPLHLRSGNEGEKKKTQKKQGREKFPAKGDPPRGNLPISAAN